MSSIHCRYPPLFFLPSGSTCLNHKITPMEGIPQVTEFLNFPHQSHYFCLLYFQTRSLAVEILSQDREATFVIYKMPRSRPL